MGNNRVRESTNIQTGIKKEETELYIRVNDSENLNKMPSFLGKYKWSKWTPEEIGKPKEQIQTVFKELRSVKHLIRTFF